MLSYVTLVAAWLQAAPQSMSHADVILGVIAAIVPVTVTGTWYLSIRINDSALKQANALAEIREKLAGHMAEEKLNRAEISKLGTRVDEHDTRIRRVETIHAVARAVELLEKTGIVG